MSTYELEVGEFVPIDEKAGYIQNRSMTVLEYLPVKNGETPVKDTGMYLRPDEKIKFSIGDNYTAYIRATKVNRYGAEQKANVVVEAAMASGSSGGSMDHDCCCCCKSGFKEWYSGMAVSVGTYVEHDNKIYKCTTPNADVVWNPANWVEISASSGSSGSSILSWNAGDTYTAGQVVIYNGNLYQVTNSHTAGATFSESNFTKIGGCDCNISDIVDTSKAKPWATGESFSVNDLVSYGDDLYMCLISHTSGDFDTDFDSGYWRKVSSDQTVVGGAGGYSQVTKMNVTAPLNVNIDISPNMTYCYPPVEVLKLGDITAEVTLSQMTFDQGDSLDFEYNSTNIGFNGVMYTKTDIKVPCTAVLEHISKKYLLTSENININNYKDIQNCSNSVKAQQATGLANNSLADALGLKLTIAYDSYPAATCLYNVTLTNSAGETIASMSKVPTANIVDGSTINNATAVSFDVGDSGQTVKLTYGELFDFSNLKRSGATLYAQNASNPTKWDKIGSAGTKTSPLINTVSDIDTFTNKIDGISGSVHAEYNSSNQVMTIYNTNGTIALSSTNSATTNALSMLNLQDVHLKSLYVNNNKAYGILASDETDTFTVLSDNWSTLSDNEKINLIDSTTEEAIPFETISSVLSEFEINSSFIINSSSYTLKAIPYSELILPKKLISTNRFYSLNNVTMAYNIGGTGTIHVAVTNNLDKYYIYDNATENWKEVSSTVDSIKQGNMHITNIASIPTSAWNSLIRRNDSKGIAFAYVLDINDYTDKAEVDSMTFNVDIAGQWEKAIYGTDFIYGYSNADLTVNILNDGSYKINYYKDIE